MSNIKKGIGLAALAALLFFGAFAAVRSNNASAQSASGGSNSSNSANGNGNMFGRFGKGRGHGFGPLVAGTVSSVSGNTITLSGSNGTTYTVDASNAQITKVSNGTNSTIQISGVQSGDTIGVVGTVSGSNITATKIIDGNLPHMQSPAASGTVASINGNTLTLTGSNGTTYTVDASQAAMMIAKPAGTALQNSGVQVGDSLKVFGTVSGSNITATRILDGNAGFGGHGFGPFGK